MKIGMSLEFYSPAGAVSLNGAAGRGRSPNGLASATRERNPRAGIAPISPCLERAAQLSRRARGGRQGLPKLSGDGPGHSRLIPLKLWAPVGPATPGLQHGSVLRKQTTHPSRHVLQKKSFLKKDRILSQF